MSKNIFSCMIIAGVFASCNPAPLSDYSPAFKKIMLSETGLFRGLSLGEAYGKIRSSETGTLLESDSSYLFYEYILDSADSYTVEYQFENHALSEIRLDAYIKNAEEWKMLFENLREYYNSKYGLCAREKDSFVWKVDGGSIHIVLSDETADASENVLSLEIFYASLPS